MPAALPPCLGSNAHLAGRGVFALWDAAGCSESVTIGCAGELVWGDQLDLRPDSLYLRVTGKTPESVFPRLHGVPSRA